MRLGSHYLRGRDLLHVMVSTALTLPYALDALVDHRADAEENGDGNQRSQVNKNGHDDGTQQDESEDASQESDNRARARHIREQVKFLLGCRLQQGLGLAHPAF